MQHKMALSGIRVLDLGRYIAAPYCTAIMADMGAEVIRVERPGGEEDRKASSCTKSGVSLGYLMLNRGKKSITLNLLSPEAKDIFQRLVKHSDVLIHNQAPGFLENLGLGYEQLKDVNPRLIMAAVSGFGQYGPNAGKVSYDSACQALSGAMSVTGFPDNPPTRSQVNYVDYGAALHACVGILLALRYRDQTGEGQLVDIALYDSAVLQMHTLFQEYLVNNEVRQQVGNMSTYVIADCYMAKDGWLFINLASNPIWRRMARLIGQPGLADDPEYGSDNLRWQYQEKLHSFIKEWIAHRTVEQAIRELDESRIPHGRVCSIPEVMADPQVRARDMIVHLKDSDPEDVPLTGMVIKMSRSPGVLDLRAPDVGEHNFEIYNSLLGLSGEELAELSGKQVI